MEIKKINIKSSKIQIRNNIDLESMISRNNSLKVINIDGQQGFKTNLVGKNQCFIMNSIGSIIWDIIEEPIKVNSIIDEIMKKFTVHREVCESDVIEFLNIVKKHNIIRVNF